MVIAANRKRVPYRRFAMRRWLSMPPTSPVSFPQYANEHGPPDPPRNRLRSLRLRVDGSREKEEINPNSTPSPRCALPRSSSPSSLGPCPPPRGRLEPGSAPDVGVPRLRSVCDGKQVIQLKDQGAVGCHVPVGDETTELRSEDTPLVGSEHRIQGSDFGVVLPEIGTEPVH